MRWTHTFIPTLKETPADAEITSHKLLLRAGLLRKLTGGLYTFLPLGVRALRKIERIVREEMDRAGALEVLMPALQPPEIWEQSGRYETMKDVLYKVRDRAKKEWVLGPTHEEVITSLVAGEINSYRQMPKNFYQIGVKFRDEIRPRFGLLRAKEFLMKDAYSFDASDEAAQVSYQKMYDAYAKIFARCGLKTIAVEASSGATGANPGSLGAVASTRKKLDVPVFADERLRGANDMTTGANEDGFHLRNVSMERDIQVSQWADLRTVTAGEPCAKCGKPLKFDRA